MVHLVRVFKGRRQERFLEGDIILIIHVVVVVVVLLLPCPCLRMDCRLFLGVLVVVSLYVRLTQARIVGRRDSVCLAAWLPG